MGKPISKNVVSEGKGFKHIGIFAGEGNFDIFL